MSNNKTFTMRFLKLYSLYVIAFLAVGLVFPACQKDPVTVVPSGKQAAEFDSKVVVGWDELFLEVERYAGGYRPGPAPRAMAYIGLANYEACVSAMPEFNSVASLYAGLNIPKVQGGQEYHWPSVVNASYARLMRNFFIAAKQDKQDAINALEATNELKFNDEASPEVIARSIQYGKDVAAAVWEWSKTDSYGHDAYLTPFDSPVETYDWNANFTKAGDWLPTAPGPGRPMYPFWGKVRSFAIRESDKLCPAPWAYGEDKDNRLYAEAIEVYARTKYATYDDKWMGEFWSDDLVDLTFSPGPRWMAIMDEVLNAKGSNLETGLYAAVKVGMATSDCAVACWYSKYYYNVERPASYIQRVIDPAFQTALYNPINGVSNNTPSFPAYPSGHSTMGGGAAEVLTDIFGIHFPMADRCHENRSDFLGIPRSFNSFYEMAEENAISRVPLGVHFRMDCEAGVSLGYRVGRRVNEMPWKK